jgi:hypothetical protein
VYLVSLELVGTVSFFLWLGVALAVRRLLPARPLASPAAA